MLALLAASLVALPQAGGEAADLAAARALFERNVAAIQARDREGYLDCYRPDERLVRAGAEGFELGFAPLAEGTPPTGGDAWPDSLVARDLRLTPVAPGVVYGTYRYRVVFDGEASSGISERLFVEEDGRFWIAVSTAFEAPAGTPPPPVALVGATVVDGGGGAPIEDAVVVVRSGVIDAVGARGEVEVPEGVDVVELAGRFVVPGLVDAHVHYSQTGWADGRPDFVDVRETHPYAETMAANARHPERFHRAFLYHGVTAVFDVGGFPWTRGLAEATERALDAPHVVATGPLLATFVPVALRLFDQDQFVQLEDEAGARAAVRSHAAHGSDAIKVWYVLREPGDLERYEPLVRAAGDEARARGLPLVVHATSLESARVAVEAGARLLVHSVGDRPVDEAFVAAAREAGVLYCPTLTVREGYLALAARELSEELVASLGGVGASVRERVLATRELPPDPRFTLEWLDGFAARLERERETMSANLVRLHEAGVPVVLGTDAGNPLTLHGPSVFAELEAMQAAGLAPADVLVAATRDAARALGRGDDLGRIAPGYVADLVVLEEDPTADVANLRAITHVMRGGCLLERELLRP